MLRELNGERVIAILLAGIIAAPAVYNPVRTGDDTLTSYNTRRDSSFTR